MLKRMVKGAFALAQKRKLNKMKKESEGGKKDETV
jgi:hypothetical protein